MSHLPAAESDLHLSRNTPFEDVGQIKQVLMMRLV